MSFTKQALHFALCPICGGHGRFVLGWPLTNVKLPIEIYSKEAAYKFLEYFLKYKLVDKHEYDFNRDHVSGLSLQLEFSPRDLEGVIEVNSSDSLNQELSSCLIDFQIGVQHLN